MKKKLIVTSMVMLLVVGCVGLSVNQKVLVDTTLESAAFLLGNLGAKKNPVAFHAAALVAKRAMEHPLWDLAFTEKTLNEMWVEVMPYLSGDPAMLHLAKKWLTIVEYDDTIGHITVPPEYGDLIRNGISEFTLGVQMAGLGV